MFLVLFASLYCLCFCMYVLFDVPYDLFCECAMSCFLRPSGLGMCVGLSVFICVGVFSFDMFVHVL